MEKKFDKGIYLDTPRDIDSELVNCKKCKHKGKGMLDACYENIKVDIICGYFEQK